MQCLGQTVVLLPISRGLSLYTLPDRLWRLFTRSASCIREGQQTFALFGRNELATGQLVGEGHRPSRRLDRENSESTRCLSY